jgi:hypothetical protein
MYSTSGGGGGGGEAGGRGQAVLPLIEGGRGSVSTASALFLGSEFDVVGTAVSVSDAFFASLIEQERPANSFISSSVIPICQPILLNKESSLNEWMDV